MEGEGVDGDGEEGEEGDVPPLPLAAKPTAGGSLKRNTLYTPLRNTSPMIQVGPPFCEVPPRSMSMIPPMHVPGLIS